jgi:hypothetical protein
VATLRPRSPCIRGSPPLPRSHSHTPPARATHARSTPPLGRAWRKTNWDDAEKKLEEGDLPDLLVSEDKIAMDDYDRRRGEGLKLPEDDVALK